MLIHCCSWQVNLYNFGLVSIFAKKIFVLRVNKVYNLEVVASVCTAILYYAASHERQ